MTPPMPFPATRGRARLLHALPYLPTLVAFLLACAVAGCAMPAADAAAPGANTLAGASDRFVDLPGGVRMRYREIGTGHRGAPVVLLHGYTDRVEMFVGLADSIARTHRVLVPDLRGFGLTTKFPSRGDYGPRMVDDLVAFMDSLRLREAHVLGYSMGALLAAHLALREPAAARVASLTFVAGPFLADSAATALAFTGPLRALERGEGVGPFMRWIMPDHPDSSLRAITALIEQTNDSAALVAVIQDFHALALDWRAVERTTVPAVAIVARRDPLVPESRYVAERWPGARLVEIARGDHGDITTQPEVLEEFRRVVAGARARR